MLPWETLRARDDRRARRRTDRTALEQLEGRQLLSYSSLGYSLPDLRVSGSGRAGGGLGQHASGHGHSPEHRRQHDGRAAVAAPRRARSRPAPTASPCRRSGVPSSADAGHVGSGRLPDATAALAGRRHLDRDDRQRRRSARTTSSRSPHRSSLPQHPVGFPSTGIYLHPAGRERDPVGHGIELREQYEPGDPGAVHLSSLAAAAGRRRSTCLRSCSRATRSPRRSRSRTWARRQPTLQGPVQVALVASVISRLQSGQLDRRPLHPARGHSRASRAPRLPDRSATIGVSSGRTGASNNVDTPGTTWRRSPAIAVTLPTSPGTYYPGNRRRPEQHAQPALPAHQSARADPGGGPRGPGPVRGRRRELPPDRPVPESSRRRTDRQS